MQKNFNLKFILFFFLIILKSKAVFALDFNNYFKDIISYLLYNPNPIYIFIYVCVFGLLVYFFWQVFSLSPFSDYVSIIFSFGLVIILSLTKVIGIISTYFYNISKYIIDKGLTYEIISLIVLLLCLFLLFYLIRWIVYLIKGNKKQRKKEKEKLEREEEKAFYEGIKGK